MASERIQRRTLAAIRERHGRHLGWGVWVLSMLLLASSYFLWSLNRDTHVPGGIDPAPALLAVTFLARFSTPAVGLIVATRRPEHPVGWILTGVGLVLNGHAFSYEYGVYAELTASGPLPAGPWAAWTSNWIFLLQMPLLTLLFLLFPDGRLLSRRWSAAAWLALASTAVTVLAYGLRPGPLDDAPFVQNPAGLPGTAAFFSIVGDVGVSLLTVATALAAASIVLRLRRAGERERLQIKWFAYAAVATLVTMLLFFAWWIPSGGWAAAGRPSVAVLTSEPLWAVPVLGLTALPVAIAIGILRYRLFEIDRIINRTIVYAPLTAMIGGLIPPSILTFGWVLRSLTGSEQRDATLILSALFVAALVSHFRGRIQAFADRYCAPHDPVQHLVAFRDHVESVLEVLDEDRLAERLLDQCVSNLGAPAAAIYLQRDDGSWQSLRRGDWYAAPAVSAPLAYGGISLGRVELAHRSDGEPYSDAERQAFDEAAAAVAHGITFDRAHRLARMVRLEARDGAAGLR